jgi:hypothetical protein
VLAASVNGAEFSEDPAILLEAAGLAARAAQSTPIPAELESAVALAERWLTHRRAAAAAGESTPLFRAPARRTALHRIAAIAHRAPHHRRALLSPLCASARRIVTTPFGLGAERILETLAQAPLADEPWLRALTEFGAIHAGGARDPTDGASTIIALLVIARL